MTREWKYLIYLYKCGVFGEKAEAPTEDIDLKKILEISNRHAISGITALALKNADFCPTDIKNECKGIALGSAISNDTRKNSFFSLLNEAEKSGFHPVIIKGYDISRFYAVPECRNSADNDIFIPESEENGILELFEKLGCTVKQRSKNFNHSEARHTQAGIIEIHVKFLSDFTETGLVGNESPKMMKPKKSVRVNAFDTEFSALDPNDAIFFLSIHLIKHFIRAGISLRQAFDYALYFARCADKIDTDNYWEQMKKYDFYDFLQSLLSMFVHFDCFDKNEFPGLLVRDEKEFMPICEDMEVHSEMNEADYNVWDYYYYHHIKKSGIKTKAKVAGRRIGIYAKMCFPSFSSLSERYTYLKKRKYFLYPIAWFNRAFDGMNDKSRKDEAAKTVLKPQTISSSESDINDSEETSRIRLLMKTKLL